MDGLFKISELQARYKLASKQSVYDRIRKIDIVPVEKGYISSGQLDRLDRLDKHLKAGGNMADFGIEPEIPTVISRIDEPVLSPVDDLYQKTFDWMGGIVEQLIAANAQKTSILHRFEELEKAAFIGLTLPTSAIAQLTGIKPKGDGFDYGCFSIQRYSKKMGREASWVILKQDANETVRIAHTVRAS